MDRLTNYLMEYIVYGKDGSILKKGKIKAKMKKSEFEAKAGFGNYITKKYGETLGRLEIISCKDDSLTNMFGEMFGKDNPFDNIFGG